jgi:hypothetical protein
MALQRPLGQQGQRVARILQGYKVETSESWALLKQKFGPGIRHRELYSIASVIACEFNITGLSRDSQRSIAVLLQWFEQQWSAIEPILPLITQCDENREPIDHTREILLSEIKYGARHRHSPLVELVS